MYFLKNYLKHQYIKIYEKTKIKIKNKKWDSLPHLFASFF